MAVSLHSVVQKTRARLVPESYANKSFLPFLQEWTAQYFRRFTGRKQRLCYECVLINEINDSPEEARALLNYANKVNNLRLRINLIPFNNTSFNKFTAPDEKKVKLFQTILRDGGLDCFIRKSRGVKINAACGQLVGLDKDIIRE